MKKDWSQIACTLQLILSLLSSVHTLCYPVYEKCPLQISAKKINAKLCFNKMHHLSRCGTNSDALSGPQDWKLKDQCWGKTIAPVWTMERGNKGEQDIHLGVVYLPKAFCRSTLSLTPGANHNFKASLRPISPWPLGLPPRIVPPGLVRIGCGVPVKQGRGLISSAKCRERCANSTMESPDREGWRSVMEEREGVESWLHNPTNDLF